MPIETNCIYLSVVLCFTVQYHVAKVMLNCGVFAKTAEVEAGSSFESAATVLFPPFVTIY